MLATVVAFQDGIVTERGGVIWNGVDTSVVERVKIQMQMTCTVYYKTKLKASALGPYNNNGIAVNPCNTTPAWRAPWNSMRFPCCPRPPASDGHQPQ